MPFPFRGAACAAALALASLSLACAADLPGSADHPLVGRFTGAEIVDYQAAEFDESALPVKAITARGPQPATVVLHVEGKITRIRYLLPRNKSGLEVMRSYEQGLRNGFKTVFACTGNECGAAMTDYLVGDGKLMPSGWTATFHSETSRYLLARRSAPAGDVYVLVFLMDEGNGNPVTVFEEVVELRPMAAGQVAVLNAASLQRSLDSDGKVALYGLYFETAKADMKADSKPSLDEMAKLLGAHPALKVYIVGHTDNTGTLAANLELSQRRAEAVVKALATGYRIDPQRLAARGVASLAPVSSNADEAGRARNRRVELVAQ